MFRLNRVYCTIYKQMRWHKPHNIETTTAFFHHLNCTAVASHKKQIEFPNGYMGANGQRTMCLKREVTFKVDHENRVKCTIYELRRLHKIS